MPTVTFLPAARSAAVPVGTSLLDAATQASVVITAPCGGEGACGECRVQVTAGEVERVPRGCLTAAEMADGWILACSSRVAGDVTIRVPEAAAAEAGRIVAETMPTPRTTEADRPAVTSPLTTRCVVHVEPPSRGHSPCDYDRLCRALQTAGGPGHVTASLEVLRQLPAALRAKDHVVTVTMVAGDVSGAQCEGAWHDRIDSDFTGETPVPQDFHEATANLETIAKPASIIRIESGDATARHVGLAVDVGTTTCAVSLMDLARGGVLGTAADYNAQLARGSDIISRINYAQTPERLAELRDMVLATINGLVQGLCHHHGISADQIDSAVVAGNTTMIHLLLGIDPRFIRLDPYTPTVNRPPMLEARHVGLAIHPDAPVLFAPAVGSYVGGDITAGLLMTAMTRASDQVRLFLDIGTNGEVVVGNGEWLMACAASAGPAFEGSGVSCGMRAGPGAIERVRIDAATGEAHYTVIGGGLPKGVCGSGMIDLLAELWTAGLLDPAGKLDPARGGDRIRQVEGSARHLAYVIAGEGESATGQAITIDERDIQNLLRTKAAIYSACALMLKSVGLGLPDIAEVYVAGGFGRYLDLRKSITIGLLPDLPLEQFTYLGNSALGGAQAMLCGAAARRDVIRIADRLTYLELNVDPAYMAEYTAALFLPHTDIDRFPTVKAALRAKGQSAAGDGNAPDNDHPVLA